MTLHCGCCGGTIGNSTRSDPDWCKHCRPHISVSRSFDGHLAPPWERTYYAQHKTNCPLQAPTPKETRP